MSTIASSACGPGFWQLRIAVAGAQVSATAAALGSSSSSRSTAASTSDGGSGFDHVEVQPGVHGRGRLRRLGGAGLAGVYVFTWKFLVWQMAI